MSQMLLGCPRAVVLYLYEARGTCTCVRDINAINQQSLLENPLLQLQPLLNSAEGSLTKP